MEAVYANGQGDLTALKRTTEPLPEPSIYDVLVETHACGVSRLDCEVRSDDPAVSDVCSGKLGWSISGVAVRVGSRVTEVHTGDRVYGLTGFPTRAGGYAEYGVLPTETVLPVPENLSLIEAAGVPLAAMVAYQALFDIARVRAKHRVLVMGGAGAIGHFATQMARNVGASVCAVASERNHAFLRSLGASEVAPYERESDIAQSPPCDVVIDPIGGSATVLGLKVLVRGGILVSLSKAGRNPHTELRIYSRRIRRYALKPRRATFNAVNAMLERGVLQPAVMVVNGLDELPHAHALSESGHARGSIVCQVR